MADPTSFQPIVNAMQNPTAAPMQRPVMGTPGQIPPEMQQRYAAQNAKNQAVADQLRARNMPGVAGGLGQGQRVPPGGGMAAAGFANRAPMAALPRAGQPGGGMAAAGAKPPPRPMPGAGMKPAAPQAGPFGQPTKFPTMQGSFGRNSR